jgi:hypothetical protein
LAITLRHLKLFIFPMALEAVLKTRLGLKSFVGTKCSILKIL